MAAGPWPLSPAFSHQREPGDQELPAWSGSTNPPPMLQPLLLNSHPASLAASGSLLGPSWHTQSRPGRGASGSSCGGNNGHFIHGLAWCLAGREWKGGRHSLFPPLLTPPHILDSDRPAQML